MEYEWADVDFKWDRSRDLKDSEPFFSSGDYIDRSNQGALKTAFKGFMDTLYTNLQPHEDHTKATIQKVRNMCLKKIGLIHAKYWLFFGMFCASD